MAATVGATLSTVAFPLRHSGMGPFISSGGNVYFFGRDTTNTGQIEPHKASDPMTSFTAQTAKTMSSGTTTAIEAMWTGQSGNTIYIFAQISTGAVYFNAYTMDTDAWLLATSATTIAAAGFAPSAGYTFVSAVYRPTAGELVVAYCAGLTAMASGFHMVRYARVNASTGAVIGSAANVDNGGSVNWSNGLALLGASDRVHVFLKDNSNFDLFQRTLTAANALQTFPATFEGGPGSNNHNFGQGTTYISGATTKVVAPHYGGAAAGSRTFIATLDSADAPTVSTGVVGDNSTKLNANTVTTTGLIHGVSANGTDVHLLYGGSADGDLYHDVNTSADVNEFAATLNYITSNVYTRSGSVVLAMVLDDGGAIKYAEITLGAAAPAVIHRQIISSAAKVRRNRH